MTTPGWTISQIARARVATKRLAAKEREFQRREREHAARLAGLLANPPIALNEWSLDAFRQMSTWMQ